MVTRQFDITEPLWSFGTSFTITDKTGQIIYQVKGSFLKWFKTFTITDKNDQFVAELKESWQFFHKQFSLQLADGQVLTIRKKWLSWKPRYSISHLDLQVKGDFWNLAFTLLDNDQELAKIQKKWLRLTSTYHIEVYDETYSDLVIALVLAIEQIKKSSQITHTNLSS